MSKAAPVPNQPAERPPNALPSPQTVERGIERRARASYDGTLGAWGDDELVVEAPLSLRIAGEPLVTTMRTPGDDEALALGFLLAEGLIRGVRDVGTLTHCGRPDDEGWGNTLEITAGPGFVLDPEALETSRRGTLVSASCGVCGRRSIDDLMRRIPRGATGPSLDPRILVGAPETLRRAQPAFARTGALHAAGVVDGAGTLRALAEDVGRHNAVDKVVGRLLQAEALDPGLVLVVSGRTSFEIVQKAAMAGFAAVVAVSGPSTLAVDLAERAGIVLCGFARDGRMNVYTHGERLQAA